MSKKLIFILCAFPWVCFGQVPFDEGYYIDNEGKRVDCFIQNLDAKSNPAGFKYVLKIGESVKTADITSVSEFGILHFSRFVRARVKMDRSSDRMGSLSTERNPIFQEEQLFLKVIVEGKATLYYYRERNLVRFFYRIDELPIQQFVYKKYLGKDEAIGINQDFRQQLLMEVNCGDLGVNEAKRISYAIRPLARYFQKYNVCKGGNSLKRLKRKSTVFPHLGIATGIDYADFNMSQVVVGQGVVRRGNFEPKTNLRFGLQAELQIRATGNNWSIRVEPNFQSFKASQPSNVAGETISIDYKSIEVPIGLRRYFNLTDNSKLFLNAFFVRDIGLNGSNVEWQQGAKLGTVRSWSYAFGGGYSWRRLAAEVRFYSRRDIMPPSSGSFFIWNSEYKKTSLILSFRLF